MDVRMPDGTIVRNVPDNVKPEELRRQYQIAASQLAGEEAIAGAHRPELIAALPAKDVPSPLSAVRLLGGYLLGASPKQLEGIVKEALPGATIRHETSTGNPIVEFQGKEYYINKEGFSEADLMGLAGSILLFGKVGKLVSKVPSVLGRVITGIVGGGATSVVADFGAAALGAETGIDAPRAVGSAIAGGVTAPASRMRVPAPYADAQAARGAANAAYNEARQAGLVLDSTRIPVANWEAAAHRAGLDIPRGGAVRPSLTPQSASLLGRIQEDLAAGNLSLDEMETLRQIAVGIRESGRNAGGTLSPDGSAANALIRQMDDFVNGLSAADIVAGGNPRAAEAALREARSLWRVQAKANTIEELRRRADLAAPTKGWEQALRDSFRPLSRDPSEMSQFTREEQAAIREIVRGGTIDSALRLLGQAGPAGMAMVGGAAALASGASPMGVAQSAAYLGGAGAVAGVAGRTMAGRESLSQTGDLMNQVLGGQTVRAPWLLPAGEALARREYPQK